MVQAATMNDAIIDPVQARVGESQEVKTDDRVAIVSNRELADRAQ